MTAIQPDHSIDLSLDRVIKVLAEMENPHLRLPSVIHVAGTNGKGSTLAYLSAMIEISGKTYHRYTSPHLVRLNERFIIRNQQVSDAQLQKALDLVEPFELTPFEKMTVAAFHLFSETPADYVLLETGLGGRLDATNVIPNPLVTIITSISYDHESYLGNTIEAIAAQKAEIIKKGSPVVLARQPYFQAHKVVLEYADKLGAPVFDAALDCQRSLLLKDDIYPINMQMSVFDPPPCGPFLSFASPSVEPATGVEAKSKIDRNLGSKKPAPSCYLGIKPGLIGPHQFDNAANACMTARILKLPSEAIEGGLKKVFWPGRLQCLRPGLWIDGAHNPDAFLQLKEVIEDWQPQPVNLVLGLLQRRDPTLILKILKETPINKLYLIAISSEIDFFKFWPVDELAHYCVKAGLHATPLETIDDILNIKEEGITLVAGSLHLIGKLIEAYEGEQQCIKKASY